MSEATPVQPVDQPIICNPYEEPNDHWLYDRETGEAKRAGHRRPAGYWYKTERTGADQQQLFLEEQRDDLTLVNLLREDVGRWRDSGYRGASKVTRELLRHWAREDGLRRLFFCQREAVETMIYLCELRIPGRSSRTGFRNFALSEVDLKRLLAGERPSFASSGSDFFQTLIDQPAEDDMLPLTRLGCKMATGSGKTVVMAMLIAWAFCNRGINRASREYPHGVLVCCPNLTVKERLQVLRPEMANNFYEEFDIVPAKYRYLLQFGKVLITNWNYFQEESEHREGDKSYAVVNKGPETRDSFARRVLGDLYDRMPIMVFNDEGHHCWRPAPVSIVEELEGDEKKEMEAELKDARVWLKGLDKLNNVHSGSGDHQRGIMFCVDFSATPFYLQGSGHIEGSPFPWLVNDFGLVDAIECGIVKIPRLPVSDTTGRPEPKYFKLWEKIKDELEPAEFLPGKAHKPKPESVWREAQGALQQLADQWVERFRYMEDATPGQEHIPPVLIIVCDNIDISKLVYEKISGEQIEDIITEEEVEAVLAGNEDGDSAGSRKKKKTKPKTITNYGSGVIHSEYFSNTETLKRTIRIDSKLLAEAESDDPKKKKSDAAEALRKVVASVGKPGMPGEHVRCVVSVSMLTEGWDANNVTQILGIRAFKSQLLCEQVVGRGLRRMDYTPDPDTGLLTEEYVDVYGIPFSVIPFKGRPSKQKTPEDKPKQHVRALPERKVLEIRFPVVEGYAFALKKNLIRCDIDSMDKLVIEPNREPTATFVQPTVGYQEGPPSQSGSGIATVEQNRNEFYQSTHLQAIQFQITRLVMDRMLSAQGNGSDTKAKVLRLQSRHQLFPQVYHFVDQYVKLKVDFQQENRCELGLEKYVGRMVDRLSIRIEPDETKGETPLLPILNQYQPIGSTSQVDFKTVRSCFATQNSHINQVVADTDTWEQVAAFRLERAVHAGVIRCYARNDHMGLYIPYEYQKVDHSYVPDFLVRVEDGFNLLLEIKGYEDEQTRAKHDAARKWVSAVNNWGKLGWWVFHVCRDPQLIQDQIAQIPTPPSEKMCVVE